MARVTESAARLPGDAVGGPKRRPLAAAPPGSGKPPKKPTTPADVGNPNPAPPSNTALPHGPVLPGDDGTGAGGGGGGGPQANPPGGPPNDHSDLLGIYGLPPDVAAKVDEIFRQYPNDPQAAAQAAIAYLRGTDWYTQTFPGIAAARQLGFIGTDLGSERAYKQYYMAYNQLYQQYYKRDMTWQEAFSLFSGGVSPDFLSRQFAGAAYVGANKNDIQYLAGAFTDTGRLSGDQLTAYGQEQAGIDTPLGAMLKTKLDQAAAKLQTIFSGTLATPSLTLGGAGLSAPNLLGTKTTQNPDIQA